MKRHKKNFFYEYFLQAVLSIFVCLFVWPLKDFFFFFVKIECDLEGFISLIKLLKRDVKFFIWLLI